MDNWYSCLCLYLYLLQRRTTACGTARINRRIPQQLRGIDLVAGASATFCGDNKIVSTKFHSTKTVHFLSTAHGHDEVHVPNRRRDGKITKPSVSLSYNKNMGGVDKQDQLDKKLFFHLLQMSVCNAFIAAKKNGYSKPFLSFLESIIISWLMQNGPVPEIFTSDDEVRLSSSNWYFADYIPPTEKKVPYPCLCCLL